MAKRFLGIVLTPAAVQCEGLNAVLDRIQSTGAHAISTGLGVVEPVERGEGRREPPLDIDGYERLFDRPLWGKKELWTRAYRTYDYSSDLFADTPYRPGGSLAPQHLDRDLPHKILGEAQARGLQAHMQVGPTVVPDLRDDDQVHYVDGSLPNPLMRVARQGCLNSPAVRAYGIALVRDAVRHYPEADGLFLDWVEYTTYDLPDFFGCFCEHCQAKARAKGYDWDGMVRDVRATWDWLHSLTGAKLELAQRVARRPWELAELLQSYPGWLDLMRFKANTVVDAYTDYRRAMDAQGAAKMGLGANGWPPPFNRVSGMDYRRLADVCSSLRPKLFTFHWSALPRWYGQTLMAWNPGLSERHLLDTLVACLDLPDAIPVRSFSDYHIPAPNEDHPATPSSWREKLDEVVAQVGGRTACHAYAHSYRSEAQWTRMIAVIRDSRADGMWVQRYGYLSDSKFAALAHMWL